MSDKKITPFKLTIPLIGESDFRTEGNQKYLCFTALAKTSNDLSHLFIFGSNNGVLMFLDENSTLINQIKNRSEDDLFTTPLTNLKFKPNFIDLFEGRGGGKERETWYLNGLLVKDPNKVEKLSGTENHDLPEITFKVVKEYKEDQEGGNYKHLLEVELLDLGIEDLPKITKLLFCFSDCSNAPASEKHLKKSKFYNSNILTETVGKTFSMKVKCWNFGLRNSKYHSDWSVLSFFSSDNFEFDSFQEVKEDNDTPPRKLQKPETPQPEKNDNASVGDDGNSKTLKKFLIVGGIITGLISIILLFYWILKEKNSPER